MGKNKIIATVKRFICLALTVILLSEAPSWEAIAAEPVVTNSEENTQTDTSSGTWTELTEQRTENTKWFTDSDGSLKVAVYDTAVHVETEDGWQEAEWFTTDNAVDSEEAVTALEGEPVEAAADSEADSTGTEDTGTADNENDIAGNAETDDTAETAGSSENSDAGDSDDTADTENGTAAYDVTEYHAGYDTEGNEVYTYIDIPEEYLVSEGYTLYSAKINFADISFTGYSEEAESLTVGIFLGDGQEDETETPADTGAGESIGEDTAAIDTEVTEVIATEVMATEATEDINTEVIDTEAIDIEDINTEAVEAGDTEVAEEGSVEEDSWETRTIKTALSGLIDLSEDSTGPVSFTLNTATLSAYISEEAQLVFAASMGSGLVTATTTESESGMVVPLWECIFVSSETTDDATGEDYYLVDGSINTEGIDGDSEEPRIIGEIEEKRDSNTKYFLTEGGGEIAAVYPEPVHYEENGEWLDIDNTLELKEENGEERYHNKNSGVDVSFATSSTASELVIIDDGNTIISWSLAAAGPVANTYQARRFSRQLYREDIEKMLSSGTMEDAGQAAGQWLEPGSLNTAVTEILQESMEENVTPADTTDSNTTAGSDTTTESVTTDTGEETTGTDTTEENTTGRDTVSDGEETENNDRYNMEQMKVENQKEGGRYTEVLPGIDIQYIINSVNIKENIIVKNKEAAAGDITLRISHPGTVLMEEEDGSITIREDETSEEIFYRFMAPFMYDSAGAYSEEVEYILAKESEDTTLLTVRADKEWLLDGEREYPVTIDPQTETTQNSTTIADTFLRQQGAADGYGRIYVGRNAGYEICHGLVKFTSLPELDRNAIIYKAVLNLYQYGYSANAISQFNVTAHEVTQSWDEGITMLTQEPSYDTAVLDYETVAWVSGNVSEGSHKQFDITSQVRKWYAGENYGILLKGDREDQFAETYFMTSDNNEAYSNGYPVGIFKFADTTGVEGYWSYHEQSAGEAGTGYTNDFNGNLMFTVPDVTTAGGIMPLSISHVYNSGESDVSSRFGNGWRLNVMQTLTATSAYEDYPYVYTDGDGTRHYFYEDENDGNKLKDEDGLGLTITQTSSTNENLYRIIECKDKSRLIFDIWGYLRQEIDPNGNTISYNYTPVTGAENCLTSASDGTGASVSFEYNSSYTRLTGIIYNGTERRTYYTYDENTGFLTSITHTTGRTSTYTHNYMGIRKLSRAQAADGTAIEYQYAYDQGVARVSMFREVRSSGTIGRSVEVAYSNGNKTVFNYPGLDGDTKLTADNPVITYRFDIFGRPVSVNDKDGDAASYTYYSEGRRNNNLKESGSMQKTINNLIANPGIDPDSMVTSQGSGWDWIKTPGCGELGVIKRTDRGYLGNTCVQVGKAANGSGFVYQDVTLANSGTYTLSAYVKTSNITGTDSLSDGAGLMVNYLDGIYAGQNVLSKKTIQGTTNEKIDGGWERVTLTFSVPENNTTVRVMGGIFNQSGTAWFDCFQLEPGTSANTFNLVNNSGFERVSSGTAPQAWEQCNITSGDGRTNVPHQDSCSALLSGTYGVRKYLRQEINVSGSEGDVYSLGGWAKANAIPEEEFCISAEIRYSDGTKGWRHFNFDPYINDWQFTSGMFTTDDNKDTTNLTYTSIIVHAFYQNQFNPAYFDGIQLVKDNGSSYVYDDEGNVVSAKSAAEKEGFSYDSNSNLTKLVNADGTNYSYSYDSKGNLMTAQTSDGQGYSFTYDDKGNPKTSVLTGSKEAAAGSTYYIRQKTSGKYLEVKGAADADRAIAQQYYFHGGTNQQWKLVDAGSGYYYLQTMCSSSGRVLEVYQASTAAGAQVSIYTNNQSEAQKWKLKKLDDGSYQIIAKCTGDANCLTNYGGSTSDSTAITSRPVNGTHSDQSWYFEPVEGSRITTSMEYTDSGRQVEIVTDALGNTTTYSYSNGSDTSERLLTSTTDAAENVTTYTYDSNTDQLTSVTSGGKTVTYTYDNDRLTTIGHNNFNYTFTYDEFGNTASVQAGTNTLVTNEYLDHNGMISKSTYGNNDVVQYYYNQDELVRQVNYNGTAAFTYRYDSAGNVTEMTDIAAGVTYYYTSDLIGRPTVMRTNHGQALQVSYDEKNRTDAVISQVTNVTTETGFTYGDGSLGKPEAAITAVSIDGTNQVTYEYDNLGRLYKKITGTGSGQKTVTYTYKQGAAAGTTSTLVESVNDDGVVTEYTYDSLGNITSISVDDELVKSYEYDALGQLVRENDNEENVAITYTYNAGGNLTWKRTYEYTEGELGETIEELPFSYSNDWRDKLVTYKGRTITYDEIGNPLTYRDGMSFSWIRGRRLGTLIVDGTTTSYTYDDNGIRTSKTVGDVKTTYYLNGSSIQTQICGSTRLDFLYDEQGSVIGFKYNNGIYLYQKNLQGDIIGIRNSAGTTIVEYSYDSWGKILSVTGSESTTLGQLNPFRYRGYYYDEESGLYYLNSRYYDAEIGRFVNADSVLAGVGSVQGYNLFAYCNNNPVNREDSTGDWPKWFEKAAVVVSVVLVTVAVVATVAAVSAFTAGTGSALAVYGATVFLGATLSGINGAVFNASKGNSYANGYAGGFVSGAIQSAASRFKGGTVWGGTIGTGVGTAITMGLNNIDPDSEDSSVEEIAASAGTSSIKATATSILTANIGAGVGGIDYKTGDVVGAVANGCGGLMPSLTLGFGE